MTDKPRRPAKPPSPPEIAVTIRVLISCDGGDLGAAVGGGEILKALFNAIRPASRNASRTAAKPKPAPKCQRTGRDPIGRFMREWTAAKPDPGQAIQASELYRAYGLWCSRASTTPLSHRGFGQSLKSRRVAKVKRGRVYYPNLGFKRAALDALAESDLVPLQAVKKDFNQ
jgi:hypothetical protein